jgi:hypothetical protein
MRQIASLFAIRGISGQARRAVAQHRDHDLSQFDRRRSKARVGVARRIGEYLSRLKA